MMHSSQDNAFEPIDEKRQYVEVLRELKFDVLYQEMSENDIDGRLVKTLDHGMGASLRAMFDLFYPTISKTFSELDSELGTVLRFQCADKDYVINHTKFPLLEISSS